MPQAFQARKFFIPKTDPKQEVYKPVPYYFGTLSTQDAADQIAEESSLTKGDVLNVLDRYQRYVIKNLQKGYKVELEESLEPFHKISNPIKYQIIKYLYFYTFNLNIS